MCVYRRLFPSLLRHRLRNTNGIWPVKYLLQRFFLEDPPSPTQSKSRNKWRSNKKWVFMYNTVVILLLLSQMISNHTCRLAHKYPSYWPLWLRNVPNISLSTVRCGRISINDFIRNWLLSLMMKEHQEAVGNWGSYGAQVQWHLFSTDCGFRPAFLHHTVHIYTLLFDSSFLGRTCASNLPLWSQGTFCAKCCVVDDLPDCNWDSQSLDLIVLQPRTPQIREVTPFTSGIRRHTSTQATNMHRHKHHLYITS